MIDGALSAATCQAFREEILSLRQKGLLHLNSTHLVKGNTRSLLPKHGIFEAEVAEQVCRFYSEEPLIKCGSTRLGDSVSDYLYAPSAEQRMILLEMTVRQCHAGHPGCSALDCSLPAGQDTDDHAQPLLAQPAPAQPAHQGAAQCR